MSQTRILIVESDIIIRHSLAEYLRECGYKVIEAYSVDEAREIISNASLSVQIVLADADAPEGGFALAGWIRSTYPEVDVILAGSLEKAAEKAGNLCENGPAISKPYDHRLVLDHIRRLRAARDRNR